MTILILLLSITSQQSPVPRSTSASPTNAAQDNRQKTEHEQKPTKPPSSLVNSETQSPATDPRHNEKRNTNEQPQNVRITEFPAVSVTRDKIDWSLWFFSALLAVVSILQWRVLSRQATIAKNQEAQMIEAGAKTERIIAQMKETTVRQLRAYLGVSKIILALEDQTLPVAIAEVQNFGNTPAQAVRQWIAIAIHAYPVESLPESTNPQNASVSTIFPGIKNVSRAALKIRLPSSTLLGTPQGTIYVYGRITYEDVFKNERYTNFRFLFGGPEPGVAYRDDGGKLRGAMRPDCIGNDST